MKDKEGYSCAVQSSGKFLPSITSSGYYAEVYYNKKIYKITSIQITSTSYGYLLTLKGSGFESAIKIDNDNNGYQVNLTKTDPLASQSGKQPYEITVKVGSGSTTTITSGKSGGAHGLPGSEMYLGIDNYYGKHQLSGYVWFASASNEYALDAPYLDDL